MDSLDTSTRSSLDHSINTRRDPDLADFLNNGIFKTEVGLVDSAASHSSRMTHAKSSKRTVGNTSKIEDLEVSFADGPTPQPLPANVNLEAIIMNVLREAPFANGKAKLVWRKYLGSLEFQRMCMDAFWYLVGHHIQTKPELPNSPQLSRMSDNYVRLFFIVAPAYKDSFFTYFHEALACSILLCLISSFPKNSKRYRTSEFKTMVMDLCREWILGLRQSHPSSEHWIHALDEEQKPKNQVPADLAGALSGNTNKKAEETNPYQFEGLRKNRVVGIRSKYTLQHSPLVSMHLSKISSRSTNTHLTLTVGLTENPVRPIREFTGDDDRPEWRIQNAKWKTDLLVEPDVLISEARQVRNKSMKEYSRVKNKALRDLGEIRRIGLEAKHHVEKKEKGIFEKGGDVHGFSNSILQSHKANKTSLLK